MNTAMDACASQQWPRLLVLLLILFYCLVLLVPPASAEVYKWRDEKGTVHYSESRPFKDELGAEEVSGQLPPVHTIQPPGKIHPSKPKRSSSKKSAKKKSKSKSKRKSKKAARKKKCARYRAQLDKVQEQQRAGYREPRGNQLRKKYRDISDKIFHECR